MSQLEIDMPNETTIDAEIQPDPQQQALAVRPANVPATSEPRQGITPEQAKVDAIASLTMAAYARASTLDLTAEEIAALQAEFPDEAFKPGASGKENLIYIEHAFLRDRLNQVIGPGKWCIMPRSRWAEKYKTRDGEATRVYVEAMLMVRGCFVAEAVGDMSYYPTNASQNYGDAVEGAKTAALRRCCKELGVGLQAWKKDWCEGWWQRKRQGTRQDAPGQAGGYQGSGHRVTAAPTQQSAPSRPQNAPSPAQNAAVAPAKPKFPTQKSLEYMITSLKAGPGADLRRISTEYFRKLGQLMPNEEIEELPLRFVPVSKTELGRLASCIAQFEVGDPIQKAFEPHGEAPASSSHSKASPGAPESPQAAAAPSPVPAQEPLPLSQQPAKPIEVPRDNPKDPKGYPNESPYWKVVCPVPRKGMLRPEYLKDPDTIGSMYVAMKAGDQEAQRRLWGFAHNFAADGWTNNEGQKFPPSALDISFRRGLDEFLKDHDNAMRDEELDDVPF